MQLRRIGIIVVLLFGALWVAAGSALSAAGAPQRATSTPYTGDLSIFDSPGREQRLHIDRVMDGLAIAPGKSVADLGAGSGWFTVLAARRVGRDGQVYAVDINPAAIRYIERRSHKEGLSNVRASLGKEDDPVLPEGSLDSVLLLKTYHEVARPVDLLRNLRAALRPGAKVGIIDRNGNGSDHGVSKEIVLQEAKQAGYKLVEEQDGLVKDDGMDYFLIFAAQ